jgi:hypothetical protein
MGLVGLHAVPRAAAERWDHDLVESKSARGEGALLAAFQAAGLLVDAVTAAHGHQGKVDGLTKLAKLDFLLRYPALPRGPRRRRV